MKYLFVVLFLALLPWGVVAQAQENNSLVDTFAKLKPSVGALYAQEQSGDLRFLCSATAIGREGKDTVILTAYHCMQRGVSYLVNFGDNTLRPLRVWKIPHYEVDSEKYPRRYGEPQTDAALLLMPGQDIPIAAVAATSNVETGARVAMVGYPLGVAKIAYEGGIAGRFDRIDADLQDYLLLQIFGAPGSSGSSVVSVETGEIVGVLVAAKSASVGLPVIFATPIEYLEHLMPVLPEKASEVGAVPTSPPKDIPGQNR